MKKGLILFMMFSFTIFYSQNKDKSSLIDTLLRATSYKLAGAGVWTGKLQEGAVLQVWHFTDINDLFGQGGHSIIFRNYIFDLNGKIIDFKYSDNSGEIKTFNDNWLRQEEIIMGVNLLDKK